METETSAGYRQVAIGAYDDESARHFGVAWTFANAIGMGLGWPMVEYIGLHLTPSLGAPTALAVAALIFEVLLWSLRGAVFAALPSARLIKTIDAGIMIAMDVFGWVIGEVLYSSTPPGSLLRFATGSYWAVYCGSLSWGILWAIRVHAGRSRASRPAPEALLRSAAIIATGLLIFASLAIVHVLCTDLGYTVARHVGPYAGMAAQGIAFGAYMGAMSAVAITRFIPGPAHFRYFIAGDRPRATRG